MTARQIQILISTPNVQALRRKLVGITPVWFYEQAMERLGKNLSPAQLGHHTPYSSPSSLWEEDVTYVEKESLQADTGDHHRATQTLPKSSKDTFFKSSSLIGGNILSML